jgi:N-acetylglucosamine kinase-like BadF-type ATPase
MLADLHGREVSRMRVGPGNPNVVGLEGAASNLADLLIGCCAAGNIDPADVRAAVLGIAGVGSGPIRRQLLDRMTETLCVRRVHVPEVHLETDARIALEGALRGGPGVIVIAGTGSIVLGKTADGTGIAVGGWGRLLGDEGSGYFLGREALRAVACEMDGRGAATRLRTLLKEVHGLRGREEIIDAVYQQQFDIASLAPLVLRAADEADPAALDIVHRGTDLLADQAGVAVRGIDDGERVGVVLAGGLLEHDTIYARILRERLASRFPRVEVRAALAPPIEGAVLMACALVRER